MVALVELPVDFGKEDDLVAVARDVAEQTVEVVEQVVVADEGLRRRLLDASGERLDLLG